MGEANSKAKIQKVWGTHREGVMKKGKRSQCLSWSAGILELWLLNLLRATSANTSEVLLNSSCLVCLCCCGMDKFQLPASGWGGLKKHWWIVHDFEKLEDCEGGLGNLFLPSYFPSSNLAHGFQHTYQCFFGMIHLKKKRINKTAESDFCLPHFAVKSDQLCLLAGPDLGGWATSSYWCHGEQCGFTAMS